MLTDIKDTGTTMRALTNGGFQYSTEKGILPGFFPVWVNRESRMNILAWSDVRRKFRITADTEEGNHIVVHLSETNKMIFKEAGSGLYVYDLKPKGKNNKSKVSSYSFLTLVSANKDLYTDRQLKGAEQANKRYEHLGMPGYKAFFKALSTNYIRNFPVTLDDTKRALHIYGPHLAHLKGKTVRKKPNPIEITDFVPLPKQILQAQSFINLSVDYFFVQGIPVLHSISHNIHFRTVEFLMNKHKASEKDTIDGVLRILNMYRRVERYVCHN